jgi:hypothetical protein
MKKKFKIFLYLVISFLILINFQSKSSATEISDKITDNRDACNLFYKKVLESDNLRIRNWYGDTRGGAFGFYPRYEFNDEKGKWELLTDGKSITNSYNYNYNTGKLLKPGDKILKIDGIDAAKMFGEQMSGWKKHAKDKEVIKLEIIDQDGEIKVIKLQKESNSYGVLYYFLEDLKITDIDIKKSTFTTKILNTFQFEFGDLKKNSHPLVDIARETMVYKKKDGKYFRHVCRPSNEYFENGTFQDPAAIYYPDVTSADKDQETVKNIISVYLKETGNFRDEVVITRNYSNNFTVLNDFNLKSFPFDKQTLKFKVREDRYGIDKRVIHTKGFINRAFEEYLKKDDIPGWKKISATVKNYDQKKVTQKNTLYSGISIELELERKHGYYIFKVIFPIILILMVCWSVVWVDPKELEARLTITIVCLLSLIAYNFVIDSELPKLEYLTVLDWIVLISYIYATIPNFLSIISFRLQKTNLKLSNKLEVISKRYGLSSYMLSIFLIVLLNANLNPENSSSLISWMAGR